jgi:LmeA-like phospholipid-binding
VFLNIDDLGEKTLNKIAEFALSTQLERAEKLNVKIKTDPSRLAKGELESLVIDGKGLVMNKYLRMQELNMTFNTIAVSPLKALIGNIELTQPSQGFAWVVLNEADLNSAFSVETLKKQLQKTAIATEVDRISCQIGSDGTVTINVKVYLLDTRENKDIFVTVKPYINPTGKGVLLENIPASENEEIAVKLIPVVLGQAEKIFNLSNFLMDGIDLQIEKVAIASGKLTLQSVARITRFPSA